jgi:precorrin-2 dehydrogenase/sirohydrochlorin ferrochelatase
LVNVVDRPELCDFFVPAAISRGRLQIAVSTGGVSPALARRLREQLEETFGPEYGDYLELVGDFRRRVRKSVADTRTRDLAYSRLFDSDTLDRIRRGERVDVEKLVAEYA